FRRFLSAAARESHSRNTNPKRQRGTTSFLGPKLQLGTAPCEAPASRPSHTDRSRSFATMGSQAGACPRQCSCSGAMPFLDGSVGRTNHCARSDRRAARKAGISHFRGFLSAISRKSHSATPTRSASEGERLSVHPSLARRVSDFSRCPKLISTVVSKNGENR